MAPTGPDIRLCFVGDSYVAGLGDRTGLGWTGRTAVAALARGLRLTAYNLGVRRDTSLDVLARLAAETRPRLAHADDPRIVLSFGVNDTVVEDGVTRVPPHVTVASLGRMRGAADPVRMLLVGPPAVDDDQQNSRIEQIDTALQEEAARLDIPHLSCFAATHDSALWRREVREGDRYHPGAAGYELLASVCSDQIINWLEQPRPERSHVSQPCL